MELPRDILDRMLARAKAAAANAYCPHSRFPVGAAVLTASGDIYAGCNFENAAYGSTICAERNAVGAMITAGGRDLRAILIYTPTPVPSAPCGACRQVLNEFGPDARVMCVCDGQGRLELTVRELLPEAFGPKNLG